MDTNEVVSPELDDLDDKPIFTKAQMNKIVEDRLKRDRKVRGDDAFRADEAEREVAELTKQLEAANISKQSFTKLQNELTAAKKTIDDLNHVTKQNTIKSQLEKFYKDAGVKSSLVDYLVKGSLADPNVSLDESGALVMEGKPIDEAFTKTWVETHPDVVLANNPGGVGSGGNKPRDASSVPVDGLAAYQKAKADGTFDKLPLAERKAMIAAAKPGLSNIATNSN